MERYNDTVPLKVPMDKLLAQLKQNCAGTEYLDDVRELVDDMNKERTECGA